MRPPISTSAEVRWFFEGDIPQAVGKWFKASKLRAAAEKRTDTYLIYPNATSCGVKFRENKFEIKVLAEDLGVKKLAANVVGAVEIWEKWSTKGKSIDQFRQEVTGDAAIWLAVKKKRITRKYSADGASIKEVDASGRDGFADDGCNVELTRVKIHQNTYWSIAFDSFGEGEIDSLVDNLVRTVGIVLSESECPLSNPSESLGIWLSDEKSHSYPSFLAAATTGHNGWK
jgi:hypothetical protein